MNLVVQFEGHVAHPEGLTDDIARFPLVFPLWNQFHNGRLLPILETRRATFRRLTLNLEIQPNLDPVAKISLGEGIRGHNHRICSRC